MEDQLKGRAIINIHPDGEIILKKGEKKGYKVLKQEIIDKEVSYHSCVQVWCEGKTDYLIGEKTIPRLGYGPLCVFKTKEAAIRFKHNISSGDYKDYTVKSCIYRPSETRAVWFLDYSGLTRAYKSLLNLIRLNSSSISRGSVDLADYVILNDK